MLFNALARGRVLSLILLFPLASSPPVQAEVSREMSGGVPLSQFMQEIVLAHLPHEYENTKQWGGTKQVWDGLHVSLDGIRIKTKRRRKEANHGTWKRYKAWLIEPENRLQIRVANVARSDEGRASFNLIASAKLGAFARLSEWNRGVQLLSVSVNAEADVTVRLGCEMGLEFDFENLPPDVRVDPVIRHTQIQLDRLRIQRVSDLHGPLVRQLGRSLEDVLQREMDRRSQKMTAKLNRQIEKKRDRLEFSIHDLLQSDDLSLLRAFGSSALENPETLVGH